jgi:hypothetical protein
MKHLTTILLASLIFIHTAFPSSDPVALGDDPAQGQYTTGTVIGQDPAVAGWTGAWLSGTGEGTVLADSLAYPGIVSEGGALVTQSNARFGRTLETAFDDSTEGVYYMSVLLQVENALDQYRSLELHQDGFSDNPNRKLQIAVGEGGSTDFTFRLLNDNGLSASLGAGDNAVNLFVLRFDFSAEAGGDSVTVWRNPEDLLSESGSTADAEFTGFDLAFNITSLARFGSGGGIRMDELTVAESWEDVLNVEVVELDYFMDPVAVGDDPAQGQYVTGGLVGQDPAIVGWTGAWLSATGEGTVLADSLTYPGIVSEGGALVTQSNARFGRALEMAFDESTEGVYYMSVLLRVEDAVDQYRSFELHQDGFSDSPDRKLQIAVGEQGDINYVLRLFSDDDFKVNLGTADNDVNLFVLRFDFSMEAGGDSVTVWRNPDVLGSEQGSNPDGQLSGFDLEFNITSLARFGSGGGIRMDELTFGNSWEAVFNRDPFLLLVDAAPTSTKGRFYSPWLGFFNYDGGGEWIQQIEQNWLYIGLVSDPESAWMFSTVLNSWVWSSSSLYPIIYDASRGAYIYFLVISETNTGYIFNYTTQSWSLL